MSGLAARSGKHVKESAGDKAGSGSSIPAELVSRGACPNSFAPRQTPASATATRREYLPPDSPGFSPIEPLWSQVKQALKSQSLRNAGQRLKAVRVAFASITQATVRGSFHTPDTLHNLWKGSTEGQRRVVFERLLAARPRWRGAAAAGSARL